MLPISDGSAFDQLKLLVDREGDNLAGPDWLGMLAAIGFVKGQPFTPDANTRTILDRAAKTALQTNTAASPMSLRAHRAICSAHTSIAAYGERLITGPVSIGFNADDFAADWLPVATAACVDIGRPPRPMCFKGRIAAELSRAAVCLALLHPRRLKAAQAARDRPFLAWRPHHAIFLVHTEAKEILERAARR